MIYSKYHDRGFNTPNYHRNTTCEECNYIIGNNNRVLIVTNGTTKPLLGHVPTFHDKFYCIGCGIKIIKRFITEFNYEIKKIAEEDLFINEL